MHSNHRPISVELLLPGLRLLVWGLGVRPKKYRLCLRSDVQSLHRWLFTHVFECRLALFHLVMAGATTPTASSNLQCCYDAAAGTLAVTAEPGEAALLRASGQHALFSALVSACTGESSAAARRMKPSIAAISLPSSPVMSAITAPAAAVPGTDVHSRSGAVYASLGTDSAGQQAMRAAADSGLLLNPATLASVQQARQSAASDDSDTSGAALTEHGSVPTAMDAFVPDQQSSWSPCEAAALLVYLSGPGSMTAGMLGLTTGSGSLHAVQRRSLVMAGIKLGPADSAPAGQPVSAAAQPAASAAASMLYEVAWLASDPNTPAAFSQPQASSLQASSAAGMHTGHGKHSLAAVDGRAQRSIRRLPVGRHAACTAISTLEALQRFTGDAATAAVRMRWHVTVWDSDCTLCTCGMMQLTRAVETDRRCCMMIAPEAL